jgi:hypothetical protein
MLSKSLAVGLLALACVTAAAGGAYMAVRNSAAPAVTPAPATTAHGPAAAPVQETEAVVAPPAVPEPVESASSVRATRAAAAPPAREPASIRRPASPRSVPAATPVTAHRNPAPSSPAARAPGGVATAPVASHPVPEPAVARAEGTTASAAPVDPVRSEPARAEPPPPPAPEFVELEIPTAAVIGLQIETPVSTERARVEDRVEARVMRDVAVDGRTAVPAGTRALGAVTLVERGGKLKERARLGVRFHTLVLADGTQLPIRTDAIIREGESQVGDSARKIGGAAVGGAILGALIGGKKGAMIGGATGAAGGTAIAATGERSAATLAAGAVVTVRLSSPVAVEVEKK